jgi:hypothetical protein
MKRSFVAVLLTAFLPLGSIDAAIPAATVNIMQFGADPSGVNDSSSAFTKVFALTNSPTLIIPPGTYRVACGNYFTASSAISVLGSGPGVSTIKLDAGCTPTADIFQWNGKSGVSVQGITLDLNTPSTPAVVHNGLGFYAYSASATGLYVNNVSIINGTSPVFLLGVSANSGFTYKGANVRNSTFNLALAATTQNQCIGFTTVNALGKITGATVENNICTNTAIQFDGDNSVISGNDVSAFKFGNGIFMVYDTGGAGPSDHDNIVTHNIIHDTVAGVDVNNTAFNGIENNCVHCTITDNIFHDLGGSGLTNYGAYAIISNNTAYKNGKNGAGGAGGVGDEAGFFVSHSALGSPYDSANVQLVGNIAYDGGGGTQLYGLVVAAAAVGPVTLTVNNLTGVTQAIDNLAGSGVINADWMFRSPQFSLTGAGVAAMTWSALDTASYQQWRLTCRDVTPVAGATTIGVQVGEGAGPTWKTAGTYGVSETVNSGGAVSAYSFADRTAANISGENWDTTQAAPGNFEVVIGDLAYPLGYKTMRLAGAYYKSGVGLANVVGTAAWSGDTGTITALRVLAGAGNIYASCVLEGRPG